MTSEVARREQRAFWEPSKATKRAHGAKSRLLGGVPGFPGISRGGVRADCAHAFSIDFQEIEVFAWEVAQNSKSRKT